MFISADQILAHLVGDYILQSDWMATEKTEQSFAAAIHALTYSLPFLFFSPSWQAIAFIAATHFVIDRWRLARYVVWFKNYLAPLSVDMSAGPPLWISSDAQRPWSECRATGYPESRPVWLATWLLIIADNTLHLICNGIALLWL